MQRGTTAIIHFVDVHVFDLCEVVKRTWSIALRSYMKYICTIDILLMDVCSHLVSHNLS